MSASTVTKFFNNNNGSNNNNNNNQSNGNQSKKLKTSQNYNADVKEQMSTLPVIKPEIFMSDHSLVAVYCFVRNFIGASGTSAVAIDNKIEQAMDLVKSHLMFAVREEVEVLKEKIAELMDRINQLEVENTILKANASQETLSQLSTTVPAKNTPTNPTNGPVS